MNNNLTNINQGTQFDIFNYKNLGSVRCYVDQQGMKWFCHLDVCNILGIKDPSTAMRRLGEPGVCSTRVGVQTGVKADGTPAIQYVDINFINEGNLFRLITGSRKPEAQEFTNWVCDTVLPSLMNKGYYAMQPMTEMEMINKMSSHIIETDAIIESIEGRLASLEEWKAEADRLFYMYGMTGRVTIRGYAIVNNIAITNNEAKFLGGEATKLTLERGMCVDTVPDPRWGVVNTYPKEILDEVFSNYFTNRNN